MEEQDDALFVLDIDKRELPLPGLINFSSDIDKVHRQRRGLENPPALDHDRRFQGKPRFCPGGNQGGFLHRTLHGRPATVRRNCYRPGSLAHVQGERRVGALRPDNP
jgi:hypothetical protein